MMTSDNSTTSSIAIASIATTLTMIGLATAGALGYYFGCSGDHQRHPPKNDTDQSMHKDFSRSTTSESWNAKIECEHALIDVRIAKIRPLIPPAILHEEIPNHTCSVALVQNTRHSISKILDGPDDRLLVVVGPCSIHDTVAAMDYAKRLKKIRDDLKGDLEILMRVYFEKPRTAVGWKGLINDPDLNGTFNINKGLRVGRNLLLDINDLGLPVGCEFLDTISPQFTADLVSWGAIGARTTECQLHRELTSGLSMPVGFKNTTASNVQVAVDAIVSAKNPHSFLGVTFQGLSAIVQTTGNEYCHVILRGGASGTNYDNASMESVSQILDEATVRNKIMVDCSHGNSKKLHTNQPIVAAAVGEQIASGVDRIFGVMIESNIKAGNQKLSGALEYGRSITDACIDWDTTVTVLKRLAKDVQTRRAINKHKEDC